jgi:hypothetical protein
MALALRKLANKWLHIIYRIWQESKPYDEQRYLAALQCHRSPILDRMAPSDSAGQLWIIP